MIMINKQLERELLKLFPSELRQALSGTGQSLEKLLAVLPLLTDAQLHTFGTEQKVVTDFKDRHMELFQRSALPRVQASFGLKPPKKRRARVGFVRRPGIDTEHIPAQYSLAERYSPVRDQGTSGTCVGFTMAAVIESAIDWNVSLSDLFAYWASKQNDSEDDEGSSLESGQEAIRKIGICENALWPYDPDTLQAGPSREALVDAEQRRADTLVILTNTSIAELEALIAGVICESPRAVACGIPVFRISWENSYTQETGEVFDILPGDTILGYHAITLVGYNRQNACFVFRNSWGETWAPNSEFGAGYGTISYRYVAEYGWGFTAVRAMTSAEREFVEAPSTPMIAVREPALKAGMIDLRGASSPHVAVIGQTGAGKTTCIKTLIAEYSEHANFLLPDFHSDYSSDESFLSSTDAVVLDIIEDGLPFNILDLPVDDDLGRPIPLSLHIASLRNSLKLAFSNLGNRQLAVFAEAVELLYRQAISNGGSLKFSDLEKIIREFASGNNGEKKIAEALLDNLRVVFRLALLNNKNNLSVRRLLAVHGAKVFRMKLPDASQEIKKLIAIFFLSGIFSAIKFVRRLDRPTILVQDEFFLVKEHTQLFERIAREGRKFAFSLWAISQRIEDVEQLIPNAGHILIFKTLGMEEIRKVAAKVSTNGAMRDFVLENLQQLDQFEAILLKDNKTFEKVRIPPFFESIEQETQFGGHMRSTG